MYKVFKKFLGTLVPLTVIAATICSSSSGVFMNAAADSSYQMKELYEADTSIVAAPTVITEIDTEKNLNALNTDGERTQVARFELADTALNVNIDGTEYTIAQIFDACATAVLPMFTTSDTATAEAFANYVADNGIYDVILASDSTDALSAAHDIEDSAIRYAYLAGAISEDNSVAQIARNTHIGAANIAIITQDEAVSRDDAEYLQLRGIAVWLDSGISSDRQRVCDAVDCGANGVTVNDFSAAYGLYENVQDETPVLIRRSFIVGHRGSPTAAPENSLASYRKAIELGADAVETDVYLMHDGTLICNHNGTIDNYTTDENATGALTALTWDDISGYTLRARGDFDSEKFCRLEQLFELLQQNPDIVSFVEIKDAREQAVAAIVSLMEEMGVEDQIFFISFSSAALEYAREYAPYCGTGYLTSAKYDESLSVNENLKEVMDDIGSISATPDYNCATVATSIFNPEASKAASRRGIILQAWTINNQESIITLAQHGVTGITTDYPTWSKTAEILTYQSISADELFPNNTIFIVCICAAAVIVAAAVVTVCVITAKRRKKSD